MITIKDIYIVLVVMACLLGSILFILSVLWASNQWVNLWLACILTLPAVFVSNMGSGMLMVYITERTVK